MIWVYLHSGFHLLSFAENYSIVSNFCIVKVDTGCNVLDGKKTQQNKELDNEICAESLFPDHVDFSYPGQYWIDISQLNSIIR